MIAAYNSVFRKALFSVNEKIVGTFPKLGTLEYELLLCQRGNDSGLSHVALPYTAKRLKDACGNSKIYIRPLQEDIELDEVSVEEEVSNDFHFE